MPSYRRSPREDLLLARFDAFKAAVLTSPDGGVELVYLIEDHGNGLATIMIPSAPNPMGGAIKIVPRERIQMLNVRMSAVTRVPQPMGCWGASLIAKGKTPVSEEWGDIRLDRRNSKICGPTIQLRQELEAPGYRVGDRVALRPLK